MARPVTPTSIETQSRIMAGPPPVGFLQAECVGGALGLCAVFEEICYVGGMVVSCGTGAIVPICIVTAGVAICYTIGQILDKIDELVREIDRKKDECTKLSPNRTGDMSDAAHAASIKCLEELQRLMDELAKWERLVRGNHGVGTTDPNGTTGRRPSRQL
jgi:hypothetical protein